MTTGSQGRKIFLCKGNNGRLKQQFSWRQRYIYLKTTGKGNPCPCSTETTLPPFCNTSRTRGTSQTSLGRLIIFFSHHPPGCSCAFYQTSTLTNTEFTIVTFLKSRNLLRYSIAKPDWICSPISYTKPAPSHAEEKMPLTLYQFAWDVFSRFCLSFF